MKHLRIGKGNATHKTVFRVAVGKAQRQQVVLFVRQY